jgi:hypothetical protein
VLNARNQHIDIDKVLECTTSFWAHTFILSISRAAFDRRLLPPGALTTRWQISSVAGSSPASTRRCRCGHISTAAHHPTTT